MSELIVEENVVRSSPLVLNEDERKELEVFLQCLGMGAGRLDGSELDPSNGVVNLDSLRERVLADCPLRSRN